MPKRAKHPRRRSRKRAASDAQEPLLGEDRLRALVEHAYDAIALLDESGRVCWASESTARVLGYRPREFVGRDAFALLHPEERAHARTVFAELLGTPGGIARSEFRYRHKNQTWRYIEGVGVNRLHDPAVRAIVTNYRDITDRKRSEIALRARERRYALAARGANDGLWDWDLAANAVHYSRRWKTMLGYADDEIGTSPEEWFSRVHADDREGVDAAVTAHLRGQTPRFAAEFRLRRKDGGHIWVIARGLAVVVDGQPVRMAGSQTDVTERKALEERLLWEAIQDPLTGLPNRAYFLSTLRRAFERVRGQTAPRFAVLFLDFDDFKSVNDKIGHLIGDEFLIAAARRLERSVRPGDTVARMGGDEFTVLLDGLGKAEEALQVVGRIHQALSSPFEVGGVAITRTASIGVAFNGGKCNRPDSILQAADRAMYRAKVQGGGRTLLAVGGASGQR